MHCKSNKEDRTAIHQSMKFLGTTRNFYLVNVLEDSSTFMFCLACVTGASHHTFSKAQCLFCWMCLCFQAVNVFRFLSYWFQFQGHRGSRGEASKELVVKVCHVCLEQG